MLSQQSNTIRDRSAYDYQTLQRLRQSCRLMLERYIDVASHCSGHLARIGPGSLDEISRTNLRVLQQKEDRARDVYLKARAALVEFVLQNDENPKAAAAM